MTKQQSILQPRQYANGAGTDPHKHNDYEEELFSDSTPMLSMELPYKHCSSESDDKTVCKKLGIKPLSLKI